MNYDRLNDLPTLIAIAQRNLSIAEANPEMRASSAQLLYLESIAAATLAIAVTLQASNEGVSGQ